MLFIYFCVIGIIEIFVFVVWIIRRKEIQKKGLHVEATIQSAKFIVGKPNRYKFQIEFLDSLNCKKKQTITVNGNVGKKLQQVGKISIIYMDNSNKVYLDKVLLEEKILPGVIIILTFLFAFWCLGL